jgi:putative flippase GtrA
MHNQKISWDSRQFGRFIAVGIVNTVFGYSLFALFIYSGLHYALASFIGTVLGVLFNFFTTGRIVFKNLDKRRLPWFFGVYGITYVLGIMGLGLLDAWGIDMYRAGLVMIPPSAVVSYILNRQFVFGGKR